MIITILTSFCVFVVFVWMCLIVAYLSKLDDILVAVKSINAKVTGKVVDDLNKTYDKS